MKKIYSILAFSLLFLGTANATPNVVAKTTNSADNTKMINAIVQELLKDPKTKNITTLKDCEPAYEKVCVKNYTKASELNTCKSTKTAGCKVILEKSAPAASSPTKAKTK